ncbi:MAG: hypothetical protein IV100_24825 [Myxococcales bacterium]|nr:hypothetical protein [Myxococcales bacterium]
MDDFSVDLIWTNGNGNVEVQRFAKDNDFLNVLFFFSSDTSAAHARLLQWTAHAIAVSDNITSLTRLRDFFVRSPQVLRC